MPVTFAPDHRGSLPCDFTFLHHSGPPDLTVETGPAETLVQTIVRLGVCVSVFHPHSLKTIVGGVGMHEPRQTPGMPDPLREVRAH